MFCKTVALALPCGNCVSKLVDKDLIFYDTKPLKCCVVLWKFANLGLVFFPFVRQCYIMEMVYILWVYMKHSHKALDFHLLFLYTTVDNYHYWKGKIKPFIVLCSSGPVRHRSWTRWLADFCRCPEARF